MPPSPIILKLKSPRRANIIVVEDDLQLQKILSVKDQGCAGRFGHFDNNKYRNSSERYSGYMYSINILKLT
jgi:hypothetical protein